MSDVLDKLSGGQLIAVFAILMGCLYLIVESITKGWARVRRTEAETALKRDMLASGHSVEDIERVTRVTAGRK